MPTIESGSDASPRRFAATLTLILLLAALLRTLFPTADPPWRGTVGVVWHDEGAWTHNARNRALYGAWTQDEWNPIYIAPVFTLLEYVSFASFGVGLRQARLVSEAAGLVSVLALAVGAAAISTRRAGLIAGALLATNYVYVMYNRAALMESTMVALMAVSWCAVARAQRSPLWGLTAGAAAVLAYFTKAAAAFFVVALALEALLRWRDGDPARRRAAFWTLSGLGLAAALALAAFVIPNWERYWFYNWQVSVTRKPSYDLTSVLDRLAWFPILHDIFTRMWLVTLVGTIAALGALARWTVLGPAERLLILWVGLGSLELIVHDVGNERRLVFLIPAFVALAALVLGRDRRLLPPEAARIARGRGLLAAPIVLLALYLIVGAVGRLAFLYQVRPSVRLSAAAAALCGILLYTFWPRVLRRLSADRWSVAASLVLAALVVTGDLAQFVQWAAGRTYKNYEAMLLLGRLLPEGTPVQGKLANGLALENRIRPLFIGRGFGNYADRRDRDEVRYILTYTSPWLGYESGRPPVILDVLEAYPDWQVVATFEVAETPSGQDRAVLIDKSERR
jgi:4-amino-4-deoxy-L-arabinose transferase-like glycosyltransferase